MTIPNDMKRFSRLTVEVDPILRASPGGAALSDADRKGMLREHRQGEPIELYADAIVYRQSKTLRPLPASKMGEANLNFVYFKPSGLKSLASSFKGRRVLADHNPSMAAIGGEIVSSELVDSGEWMEIHQTMRLSASWAVEAVLTKTLTAFSIGWATKSGSWRDAISCSVCRKKMHTSECGHFPGDQLDFDGADEKVVVESVWTGAKGDETSAVAFPAVEVGTGIEEVRAALAESRGLSVPINPPEETMADENKRLDELERQVGNLGSELAATRTKLAEAEARADKAQTQAAALLAEQAESAAKALTDERAALKAQCRASGQFIPGTVGEEVIDEMSIALLRKTAKEGKKLIPVGGAMQSGGGNGPEVSTLDKLAAFMIDKMGLTANDVEAQRRVNRSLKITDDMFIKQQIEGASSDYVEGV